MRSLWQDLWYGVRLLLKTPGFTVVTILTLAFGIGVNTAIFSVVNSVLLRPLPFPESDRLVWVSESTPNDSGLPISYPNFKDWQEQQTVFEQIGVYGYLNYNLTGSGEPTRLLSGMMSASTFTALDVQPVLGRFFTQDEDQPSASPVVVLSMEIWKNRFAGDSSIINQSITLNGRAYAVIGIMPEGFVFPSRVDIWTPVGLRANEPDYHMRANHPGLFAVARLKPGVALEQARNVMDTIALHLEQQYFDSNENVRVNMIPLLDYFVGNARALLWTLLGAVGMVLLIGCVNIANLLLARSMMRKKEISVRVALGASRWRIIRQLLTESLLLAAAGGLAGWLFAEWGIDLIRYLGGSTIPRIEEIQLDNRVLAFTALIALASGIIFGMAPAWHASRSDIRTSLQDLSRGVIGNRSRMRDGLVIVEVTLTFLLLVGAGLLLRSYYNLQTLNPGFKHEKILSFRFEIPETKIPNGASRLSFYQKLGNTLRNIPGVQTVSFATQMPLAYFGWTTPYQVDDLPFEESGGPMNMEITAISPDYFRTLGIPLLKGRFFTEQDNLDHLQSEDETTLNDIQRMAAGFNVIIVDEKFAKKHWPTEDPIGKKVRLQWGKHLGEGGTDPVLTVVGVVSSVTLRNLGDREGTVQAYFSAYQFPRECSTVLIKTTLPPESLFTTIRKQLAEIDPEQPIFDLRTMDNLRERSLAPQRVNLILFSIFGLSGLTMALMGLYAVLAHTVTQRKNEIGVRMALGAQRADVLWLFLRQGLQLTSLGIVIGLFGAWMMTRIIRSMLFDVAPTDLLTFVCVSLLVMGVALSACYIPARRAANIDPLSALRCE